MRTVRCRDDPPSSSIGGIGTTRNQVSRFEIVEEVGHDGSVHPQQLAECELARDVAAGGRGEYLVTPGATRKVGHRRVGRRDVRPKNRAEPPAEVVGE